MSINSDNNLLHAKVLNGRLGELVSGNVHRMSVQTGKADQWHHAYQYDADNRITAAYTTKETPILTSSVISQALENELIENTDWQRDAKYIYYAHGPLARVEIGNDLLQGVDMIYNLQGWIKGVNSTTLEQDKDPGSDGVIGNINEPFAKDVYGYSLHYFDGDYTAINGTGQNHAASINSTSHAAQNPTSNDLFNGNIRFMQMTLSDPTTHNPMPMINTYQFDQLDRLLESRSYETGLANNEWNPIAYDNEYYNAFNYDAMGNILTQKRHKRDGAQIEDMTYRYKYDINGNLLRNRLYHINDSIDSLVDATDIDDMGVFEDDPLLIETANNNVRDEEGRLIKNKQEEIEEIVWRVDGKVKEVRRIPTSQKKNVSFDYDAMGNQIAKHIKNNQTGMLERSTYYILDAKGTQLSVYEHEVDNSNVLYTLKERHIYGCTHLGTFDDSVSMYNSSIQQNVSSILGHKFYNLSDHRGNVNIVISDIKVS